MPRYRLLLAYDGTGFSGWWRQPGRRTVAGELDAAFAALGEPAARAVGASRTDAGVHATGQVAHVDLEREHAPDRLAARLDRLLPSDLACLAVAAAGPDFHAVQAACGKTYRYRLDQSHPRNPFLARRAWRPPGDWDRQHLARLAATLPGLRDCQAFARRGEHRADLLVQFRQAHCEEAGGTCDLVVSADRFTYRLMRSLVGAMVAVANRSLPEPAWSTAWAGQPGHVCRHQAPAHGLYLEQVDYPEG